MIILKVTKKQGFTLSFLSKIHFWKNRRKGWGGRGGHIEPSVFLEYDIITKNYILSPPQK